MISHNPLALERRQSFLPLDCLFIQFIRKVFQIGAIRVARFGIQLAERFGDMFRYDLRVDGVGHVVRIPRRMDVAARPVEGRWNLHQ